MKFNRIKESCIYLTLFFFIISFTGCSSSSSSDDGDQIPRYEKGACQYTLADGSTTECGYLIVPENRDDPESGTIKLHVAIFKNPNGVNDPSLSGPLVFLTGGPGTSTLSAFEIFENAYNMEFLNVFRQNFGDDRDLIVIDQRGTNLSEPSLYCSEELQPLQAQAYEMGYREAADLRVETLTDCYDRLEDEGIDLDGYDTFENAADIKDLATALGYDKINIYGASYGTRLSMTIMKKYPEILRSVVIDSILPPEINPLEDQPEGTMYALKTFFQACQDDYPDTESIYYSIIERLAATPVTLPVEVTDSSSGTTTSYNVSVTGVKFVAYIVGKLRETPYDSGLPKEIQDIYQNQTYQAVANQWINTVNFFFTSGEGGSYDPSVGMFESIVASSDGYYLDIDKVMDNIERYMDNTSMQEWAATEFIYWYPSTQGKWDVEPISESFQYPVISDIPTLMLVGTLDAGTPPSFSEPSSKYLKNSFFVEVLAGHATAYLPCVVQMVDDFVNDPYTMPTDTCETTYTWD